MFCAKCGSKLSDESKFCPTCGRPVEALDGQKSTGKDPKKILIIVLASMLACALILLLLFATGVFDRKDEKPSEPVATTGDNGSESGPMQETEPAKSGSCTGTISAGNYHCAAVREDGTVVAVAERDSYDWGQCDVSGWTDIVAVSCGWSHTLGLRSDGTVVATGRNDYGACDMYGWTDIVAISAGYDFSLGLRKDGTVVYAGRNDEYVDINVSGWTDIVAIDNDYDCAYGLKSDGTLVVTGTDFYRTHDRNEWSDLTAIAVNHFAGLVGLKADGTVVAEGSIYGNYYVSDWSDIVAVQTAGTTLFGLKKNGTVIWDTAHEYGEYRDDNDINPISDWQNIVLLSGGDDDIIGLKADGTVVYYGGDDNMKTTVESWDHIKR